MTSTEAEESAAIQSNDGSMTLEEEGEKVNSQKSVALQFDFAPKKKT